MLRERLQPTDDRRPVRRDRYVDRQATQDEQRGESDYERRQSGPKNKKAVKGPDREGEDKSDED